MKAREQEAFERDWVGVVEVITGEKMVKLTSIDTNKEGKLKTFPDGNTSIKLNLSDFPKPALRVIKPNMKDSKKFRVRLSADGTEVKTVTPVNGVFRGHLVGLGPKTQDGSYKLIEKTYNKGQENENSHLEFIAIYEITEGVFKGVELPGFYLHYKFEEIPEGEEDEGFTRFDTVDTPQASQLHKLQQWAEVQGDILDEPIRWPDDGIILETLEDRAIEADREVDIIFEKGYIKTVQPVEDYESGDEPEDESDEEVDEVDVVFPPTESPAKVEKSVSKPAKEMKSKVKKLSKKNSDPDEEL